MNGFVAKAFDAFDRLLWVSRIRSTRQEAASDFFDVVKNGNECSIVPIREGKEIIHEIQIQTEYDPML